MTEVSGMTRRSAVRMAVPVAAMAAVLAATTLSRGAVAASPVSVPGNPL